MAPSIDVGSTVMVYAGRDKSGAKSEGRVIEKTDTHVLCRVEPGTFGARANRALRPISEVDLIDDDGGGGDLDDKTVEDLQDMLRDRDLPVSGNKADLIKRLQEAESADESADDGDEGDEDGGEDEDSEDGD